MRKIVAAALLTILPQAFAKSKVAAMPAPNCKITIAIKRRSGNTTSGMYNFNFKTKKECERAAHVFEQGKPVKGEAKTTVRYAYQETK